MEGGIFLSHIIWLFRTRKLRKRAKLEGIDFDDLPEARRWQWNPPERDASPSGPADIETGNASPEQVTLEPKTAPGHSDVERVCQSEVNKQQRGYLDSGSTSAEVLAARLRDVEKNQNGTTTSGLGSADFFEGGRLKEVDMHQNVTAKSNVSPQKSLNHGR